MKGYILVEGHGEVGAVDNLVARTWQDRGFWQPWSKAVRWNNLHQRTNPRHGGIQKAIEWAQAKNDVGALLLLRDEDDACPKSRGPQIASWIESLSPPFPVAVVLFHPEYEVLFLPCIEKMAGQSIDGPGGPRPGLLAGTRHSGAWEANRGVKEWLTDHFPKGRSYKPVLDQAPMTRMIDLPTLRAADVPCFGTFERALDFLGVRFGQPGVYPPTAGITA